MFSFHLFSDKDFIFSKFSLEEKNLSANGSLLISSSDIRSDPNAVGSSPLIMLCAFRPCNPGVNKDAWLPIVLI